MMLLLIGLLMNWYQKRDIIFIMMSAYSIACASISQLKMNRLKKYLNVLFIIQGFHSVSISIKMFFLLKANRSEPICLQVFLAGKRMQAILSKTILQSISRQTVLKMSAVQGLKINYMKLVVRTITNRARLQSQVLYVMIKQEKHCPVYLY